MSGMTMEDMKVIEGSDPVHEPELEPDDDPENMFDGDDDYLQENFEADEQTDTYDIHNIREGVVLLDGSKVTAVHSKNSDFVIYSLDHSSSVNWNWTCASPEVDDGLHKLDLLISTINKKFMGIPTKDLDGLILSVLHVIFKSRNKEKIDDALLSLKSAIDSKAGTRTVVSKSSKFIVWISANGNIGYHYRNLSGVSESVNEYTKIKALAEAMLPPEQREVFNSRLAAVLVIAFREQPGANAAALFKPLEILIHRIAENKLRIRYILTTTLTTATLVIASFFIYFINFLPPFFHTSLVVACGGFLGTFVSVLERSNTIIISEYESPTLIILQGSLRVCLGGIFGFIAYLTAITGFAFTIFSDTTAKLLLLGVVAGFSERLIPDLIQGISTERKKHD